MLRTLIILTFGWLFTVHLYSQTNYFNNSYNYNDYSPAFSVIEHNNDYIFYGVTYDSIHNTISAYIASIDGTGELNYWNTISDTNTFYWAGYRGCGLVGLGSNGFFAAGSVSWSNDSSNGILYRFNNAGDTMWTKQYADTVFNEQQLFYGCNKANSNGFIMIGTRFVAPYQTSVLVIRADSSGNELWRKEKAEPGWIMYGYSVVQAQDKGFLIGYYKYIAGNEDSGDPVVMKVDSLGNFEWERNLGGPYRDFFTQVCLGNDGSYIAGTSLSDSTSGDSHYSRIKVFKLSSEGDIIWEKYYCMTELDNKLYSIYPDHEGGYIATGHRSNKYHPGHWSNEYGWLLKISEAGDSLWYRDYQFYSGTEDDFNKLYDLCLAPDGGYAMVGQARTWGTPQDAWVIKVDSNGCDTPGCSTGVGIEYLRRPETGNRNLYIFPNPCSDNIYIRHQTSDIKYQISIFDLYGRKQDEIIIPKGKEIVSIDVTSYPSGLYLAVLKDEKGVVARGKFIKSGSR